MTKIDDLKTRAGFLLYRQLPEEYRYQDRGAENELGDLEAYLHGFGHLLDLIRGTTEQAYADAFAEDTDIPSDEKGNTRNIQTWLLTYLAQLLGAELLAPDPLRRLQELNNAVDWFKTKGTLQNIDSMADVVSGAETVLNEGWRRVLLTPRLDLPPFTTEKTAMKEEDPLGAPELPMGTPDFRFVNRAVIDQDGANPLYRLVMPNRNPNGTVAKAIVTYWKPRARHGVPCFAGAFDDTSVRTPDLRDPEYTDVGPHPRCNLIHVRPPYGLFEPKLKTVNLPGGSNPLKFDTTETTRFQRFGPAEVLAAVGEPVPEVLDKIIVNGDLTIKAGLSISFEHLLFTGGINVEPGQTTKTRLRLSKCAVAKLVLGAKSDEPTVEALDCLLGEIDAPGGFARLVYCTVLGETKIEQLCASDCLFAGPLQGVQCDKDASCVRYSCLQDLTALAGCSAEKNPNNIEADPNFIRLYFQDNGTCNLRKAKFGELGCGVLDLTASPAIRQGAEDTGEMGCCHHLYYCAQIKALKAKVKSFLPLGQEVSIRYDPRLARPAAAEA